MDRIARARRDAELLARRQWLARTGQYLGLTALSGLAWPSWAAPRFGGNPFQSGVASGDPTPTGVVLWTRLVPHPLDGGGMPPAQVQVDWVVASDEKLQTVVRRGQAMAHPEHAHAVHVEVDGLQPGRPYWYQFRVAGEESPVGRTRTAPATGQDDEVRLAFCSCSHWEQGYFDAYKHLAAEDLHVVFHLGDYIYEDGGKPNRVRRHPAEEMKSLDQYRQRYALYRTDEHLRAVHAAHPFIVTWDDHEVDNDLYLELGVWQTAVTLVARGRA